MEFAWLSLLFQIILCLHLLLFDFPSFCFSSSAQSLCPPDQSTALLEFKTSLIVNTTYACDEPLKMTTWKNGTDCCSWLGVTCDAISGHVIGLNLSCDGLQGIIHPNSTLFQLSHLQTLNLSFNALSPTQLSSQFGGFKRLKYLDLSLTYIQGEIPSEISHLSKLVSLDLSLNYGLKWKESTLKSLVQNATSLRELLLDYTDMSSIKPSSMSLFLNGSNSLVTLSLASTGFSGNLSSDILCLPNLQKLDLSGNRGLQGQLPRLSCSASLSILNLLGCQFQGPFPSSFSNLTQLTFMSLSGNSLNCSIPSSLLTLPRLTSLDLRSCDLSGQIPNAFNRSNIFQKIDLSGNNIGGELPSSLSNLQQLIHLDLSGNQLSGSIPSSLSDLQNLIHLDLSGNQLSGLSPSSLSQLPHLTHLDLSSNRLSGVIPSSLSQLQNLIHLDISSNTFGGPIPDVFGGLTKLQELHLNHNNLVGQIPSSTFDCTHLSSLDFSYNRLEGPLPNQIKGFPNLTELHSNNNLLNGTIPSWCLSLPSLVGLYLSNNQFEGHVSAISSYSLEKLYLCSNKLQGNIPKSIFDLGNLTHLCLSSNNWSGPINFQLFSKLQNLEFLSLSQNSQLSLNFESSVNYSFPSLTSLELSSVCLNEFPKSSRNFPILSYLDLSNNKLKGRVPNWLHELDSLTFLNMSGNLLTSMDQLPRNYKFSYLDLSFNSIASDISLLVCNASTSLVILNLSHNNLTGIIPQCLTNLPALRVLDLQMNKLHGTLPNTFSRNNQLRTMNLNGNLLEGPLPESLSNCTQLELLNLGNNQIEDIFPYRLQILPYLKVLVLRGNKFHGPIASLKSKNVFPSLIIFDISRNNFSGPIPKTCIQNLEAMKNIVQPDTHGSLRYIEQFSGLNADGGSINRLYAYVNVTIKGINVTFVKIPTIFVTIDFSSNSFEGEIPNVIGELHALKGLNLSHNRLVGAIPRSMGNLNNLESLDLSSNMLTGRIPTELTNLNYLAVLDLSYNRLVGEIPQGKQFNTFSNDSYEENLGLCGFPMSIQCNNGQHSPPSHTLWNEEKFGFGWKPVAIGYGCGMVIGIGLGCLVLLIGKPQWLVSMVGGKRMKRSTRMRMRTHGTMNR